jgi:hypothetical protein
MGPARRADSLSEPEGLAPARGLLASAEGVCTRPGEVADGVSCDVGASDQGSAPERARRASGTASRRWVVTHSPDLLGISAGATPPPW